MRKLLILCIPTIMILSACNVASQEKTEIYKSDKPNTQAEQNPQKTNESDPLVIIAKQMKPQIDVWLKEKDLNEYGRSKVAGNPPKASLFDNEIGRYLNNYEFIVKTHPDMIPVWAKANKTK